MGANAFQKVGLKNYCNNVIASTVKNHKPQTRHCDCEQSEAGSKNYKPLPMLFAAIPVFTIFGIPGALDRKYNCSPRAGCI